MRERLYLVCSSGFQFCWSLLPVRSVFLTINDDWVYGGGSICLHCGYMTGFQPVQLHPFDDDDKTVKDSCTRQQLQVL